MYFKRILYMLTLYSFEILIQKQLYFQNKIINMKSFELGKPFVAYSLFMFLKVNFFLLLAKPIDAILESLLRANPHHV